MCRRNYTNLHEKKIGFLKKIPPEIPKTSLNKSEKRSFRVFGRCMEEEKMFSGGPGTVKEFFCGRPQIAVLLFRSFDGSLKNQQSLIGNETIGAAQ